MRRVVIDQYGRTRITLPSDSSPGKTMELSEAEWMRVSCPATVEEAVQRIADEMVEQEHKGENPLPTVG